ncbi:MAG: hypothetical protein KGI97_04570 [Alphaproteobacteria bacterium]|nr:hypothetical protein [Alphaproteobacteria bacterium]
MPRTEKLRRFSFMLGVRVPRVFLLCLILPVMGCTIMHAESIKDPNYKANIRRLAIVEQLGPSYFQDSFNKNLTEMLHTCGAQVTLVSAGEAFANPSGPVLKKDANGNAFDAALTIVLTSYQRLTRYGMPIGDPDNFHYTFTLRDAGGKEVWKSLMVFDSGNVVLADKGLIFAADVVKKMNNDGLFTGCAPPDEETSSISGKL